MVNSTPNPLAPPDGADAQPAGVGAPDSKPDSKDDLAAERIAVLSTDPALLTALEGCGPYKVLPVAKEGDLARTLRESPAILAVLDSDCVHQTSLARFTGRLKLQFPRLTVLVAGDARDQAALAELVARGTIYRVLLKPVPAQRLKHYIEIAWLRHEEGAEDVLGGIADAPAKARSPAKPAKSPPKTPAAGGPTRWVTAGAAALGLAAVGAIGGWFTYHWVWPDSSAPPAAGPLPPDSPLESLLSQADAALASRGFENAAELYQKAQQLAPADPRVTQGVTYAVRQVLAAAQNELLEHHLERAQALAKLAIALEPDNPRVTQLVTQISAAGSAKPANTTANSTASTTAAPAEAATEAARARLEESLRQASALLRQGHLLEPAQDNARAALLRARQLAPADPRVRQAQRALLDALLAEGRKAVAAGHAEDAERFVAPAQELGARPDEIASLQGPQGRPAHNESLDRATAAFNERLQQGKLLDPPGDSAKFYLAQLVKADPNSPATQIARLQLGPRLIAEAQSAVRRQDIPGARRWLTEAHDAGVDATSIANIEAEIAAAQAPPAPVITAPEKLTLVQMHRVEPDYPAAALSQHLTGTVDLQYTVRPDGTTAEFAIISATPVGVFEQATIDAVRKWRYRPPVLKDGSPTAVRAEVKLNFAP